ncbi:hypothetical protein GF377_07545 [candidate division GN15 bacterium]|nr:hypothetical protein [candidate division GN15 bacterium]
MTVSKLQQRKQLTVLGLNSGTSADGLDLAAVRLTRTPRGVKARFVQGTSRSYPAALREAVLQMADSDAAPLNELVRLDAALGEFYARSAAGYLRKLEQQGVRVNLIASHGQTVRHVPESARTAGYRVNGSLQLGSPERIARHTGCVVVSDLRQADVALGNEGAPITVAAMARLFGDRRESRLIVNIGGMANHFYLAPGARAEAIEAADCGPGNVLCDILAQRLYKKPYDKGGGLALEGQVSKRLLSLLLADPFFMRRDGGTTSTGREVFGPAMAERMIDFGREFKLPKKDLLATAAELTVVAIAEAVWLFADDDPGVKKLYLTGGGVRNKFITRRLRDILAPLPVVTVKELGYDPDLVEASAYAVMGEACLREEPLPTRFDGRWQEVMPLSGRLVQPPRRGSGRLVE